MKTISAKTLYTNHCIRATCITSLDQHGIEDRHIMSVSGHKSETSINSHSKYVSESKKQEMLSVLRSCINPSPQEQPASTIARVQDVVNFGDCGLESVNTDQVLSKIIQDANQQKCVLSLSNSNDKTFCGPQFHSVGQVHIHYHMSNDSIDNNEK